MSLRQVIAICGTTGVGKSKLAIQLALSLANGPSAQAATVINADSMQVYAGLDIITNKIPASQMCGVPHQLMGFKQPGEQYLVGQWVDEAIRVIDDAHRKNQVPIIVGGTSYWIQHLIFPNRLAPRETNEPSTSSSSLSPEISWGLSELPLHLRELFDSLPEQPPSAATHPEDACALHSLLTSLDPLVAARWHWKDTRKVLRSLRIISDIGRKPSEIFSQQSEVDLAPRYRTLFFWLYADPEKLNPRLDKRVDEMIQQGLLDEIKQLREVAAQSQQSKSNPKTDIPSEEGLTDYTLGIYQSIGYREFDQYLNAPDSSESDSLFKTAMDVTKRATRKYAKRQVSWIRNKLLPAVNTMNRSLGTKVTPLYLLDATDVDSEWDSNVLAVANNITNDFLGEKELPDPLSLSYLARTKLTIEEKPTDPTAILNARRKLICSVCTRNPEQPVMIEGGEWEVHQRTRAHRRLSSKTTGGRESNTKAILAELHEGGESLG